MAKKAKKTEKKNTGRILGIVIILLILLVLLAPQLLFFLKPEQQEAIRLFEETYFGQYTPIRNEEGGFD